MFIEAFAVSAYTFLTRLSLCCIGSHKYKGAKFVEEIYLVLLSYFFLGVRVRVRDFNG